MSVVRREGDWRLEKRETGFYEITYERQTEVQVFTPEYKPGVFDDRNSLTVPVEEADSFSEAESLFIEIAQKRASMQVGGFGSLGGTSGIEATHDSESAIEDDFGDIDDLPPGGFAIVLLAVGGFVVYSFDFALDSIPFLVGLLMIAIGMLVFGWAAVLFKSQSPKAAWNFLTTLEREDTAEETDDKEDDEIEKTPPAPKSLKDELYFERANQKCEWCDERVDQPEVHHIEPRSEGGPNTPSNLIVLCPGCHVKADRGAISKSKLQSKVRRLTKPNN
ncbi:HNH endonuclease [Natrialbaceae archaeon A-CW1-1]